MVADIRRPSLASSHTIARELAYVAGAGTLCEQGAQKSHAYGSHAEKNVLPPKTHSFFLCFLVKNEADPRPGARLQTVPPPPPLQTKTVDDDDWMEYRQHYTPIYFVLGGT